MYHACRAIICLKRCIKPRNFAGSLKHRLLPPESLRNDSTLQVPMDSIIASAESWVLSWSAVPFLEKPHDYAKYTVNPPSYWFVSPGVSALDLVITSAFTILLSGALIMCARSPLWQVSIPAALDEFSSSSGKVGSSAVALASRRSVRSVVLAAADYILRFLCVGCACLTVYYKGASGRFIYLLQPCHLSNFTLVALLLLPRHSELASRLFYFSNHCAFGTAMALLTPDLKALIMPGEVAYFFLQHWTLVLLPLVWMLRRRYPLYRATLRLTTLMWSLFSVLHWFVLFPFSIACNANINYMLMPPKGECTCKSLAVSVQQPHPPTDCCCSAAFVPWLHR